MVNVEVDDDVNAAADRIRPMMALYIGGMGPRVRLPQGRVRPHGLRGAVRQDPGSSTCRAARPRPRRQ
ncbi:hypothetical protein [Aeromicrobium sp. UC242_57]|uniref:hypothetical protein n=1 Tax=Aeromicrobium sp. UC242_57 TaxID=3374624 RepID=UPI00378BF8AE